MSYDLNQKMREVFNYYDKTKQNRIPRSDLGNALRSLGLVVSVMDVREIAITLDPNMERFLNFDQLETAVQAISKQQPTKDDLS